MCAALKKQRQNEQLGAAATQADLSSCLQMLVQRCRHRREEPVDRCIRLLAELLGSRELGGFDLLASTAPPGAVASLW